MTIRPAAAVGRHSARAILIDDEARLVLIKRTKPRRPPYWTTPGGGVEADDASVEVALRRELVEELGAETDRVCQVFLASSPSDRGVSVQHFFLARLTTIDDNARTGPELNDPSRGEYSIDRISLNNQDLEDVDLKPTELKHFVLANREALLAEVIEGP